MKYFRNKYLKDMPEATILDIGSRQIRNHKTYRDLFRSPWQYTGMDIRAGSNVDIVGYENLFDIFDVLISGQVMEHIAKPWEWIVDLKQYFKTYICIIAPNQHREHRYPIDTFRYFPDGMKSLFDYAGIKSLEIFSKGRDTIGIGAK